MEGIVEVHEAGEPQETRADTRVRRRRLRRRVRRNDMVVRRLLVAVVVTAVLGLGGLHWATLIPSVVLAVVAGVLAVEAAPVPALYRPALVPLALAVFTLLQAVPLPPGLLHRVSPASAQMWAGLVVSKTVQLPRWLPITADPGATYIEALKWLGYAGILAAAIAVGARSGARFGAILLFASALAVGCITFAHGLLGMHRVFGLYEPMFRPTRWHVGPLLNSNNLAGYLNLGLLSGAGLLFSREPRPPRIVVGIGVATLIGIVVICASRAGLVAMVAGLLLLGLNLRRITADRGASLAKGLRVRLMASFAAVVVAGGLLTYLGMNPETSRELLEKNVEKLDVMTHVMPLVKDYRWVGVGRGAFESVFPAYHVGATNVVYAQPENFILQWISEWGVVVGGIALLCFAVVLFDARRAAANRLTSAGIWTGIVALTLQNLLDLGFEVPGVVIAGLVAIGTLWGDNRKASLQDGLAGGGAPLIPMRVVVLAFTLALVGLVLTGGRRGVTRDRLEMHNALAHANVAKASEVAQVRKELESAMLRHPADPYFSRLGGVLAWRARDESPIPWLGRALERGMEVGATHYVVARVLAHAGARKQALLETRLAVTYTPNLAFTASKVIPRWAQTFDDLMRAVPDGSAGQVMLYAMAQNMGLKDPRGLRCLEESLVRDPSSVSVRTLLAFDVTLALGSKAADSICAGERQPACVEVVEEQVRELARLTPQGTAPLVAKANLLIALDRGVEAEALLRDGCANFASDAYAGCERLRVRAAAATRSKELLDAASRDLLGAGCGFGTGCAELYAFVGDQAMHIGDVGRALNYYQRAASDEPTDKYWKRVANAATALGEPLLAAKAWAQVSQQNPGDKQIQDAQKSQERKSLVRMLQK